MAAAEGRSFVRLLAEVGQMAARFLLEAIKGNALAGKSRHSRPIDRSLKITERKKRLMRCRFFAILD